MATVTTTRLNVSAASPGVRKSGDAPCPDLKRRSRAVDVVSLKSETKDEDRGMEKIHPADEAQKPQPAGRTTPWPQRPTGPTKYVPIRPAFRPLLPKPTEPTHVSTEPTVIIKTHALRSQPRLVKKRKRDDGALPTTVSPVSLLSKRSKYTGVATAKCIDDGPAPIAIPSPSSAPAVSPTRSTWSPDAELGSQPRPAASGGARRSYVREPPSGAQPDGSVQMDDICRLAPPLSKFAAEADALPGFPALALDLDAADADAAADFGDVDNLILRKADCEGIALNDYLSPLAQESSQCYDPMDFFGPAVDIF